MPNVDVQVAGAQLRRIREAVAITPDLRSLIRDSTRSYGLTIDEVSTLSRGTLSKTAVSKIERGEVQHPAMDSLVELARVYRMTPNDMAQLYGYYEPLVDVAIDDRRVQRFLSRVDNYRATNPQLAEVLLNALDNALRMVEEI